MAAELEGCRHKGREGCRHKGIMRAEALKTQGLRAEDMRAGGMKTRGLGDEVTRAGGMKTRGLEGGRHENWREEDTRVGRGSDPRAT